MSRPPKARQAILDAARQVVRERGAGHLTYDELVQQSGVTRGGITYHFPTKNDLLRELINCDIEQWCEIEQQLKPNMENEEAAELIAYIRSHTERNEDRCRFVSGMLSAVTLDPSLLDPVRTFLKARDDGRDWTERQLMLELLRLASEGLFWAELFASHELPANVRTRFVTMLERLAEDWTDPDTTFGRS